MHEHEVSATYGQLKYAGAFRVECHLLVRIQNIVLSLSSAVSAAFHNILGEITVNLVLVTSVV